MRRDGIWLLIAATVLAVLVVLGSDVIAADKAVSNSIKCRKQIGKEVKKMAKGGAKIVGGCHDKRNKTKRPQGDDCNDIETADLKDKFPDPDGGVENKAEQKYDKNVGKKCGVVTEEVVRLNYPNNGNIEDTLITVLASELEDWAATVTNGPDLTDKKGDKDARNCQKEAFKQGQKILDTGLKEAVKCQDKIDKAEKKKTADEAVFLEIDTGCMPGASEKVQKASDKAAEKLDKKCAQKGVGPADIGACEPFPDCVVDASAQALMSISDAMYGIPPECGNGFVETGEGCDDGDDVCGDGCDPNCQPTGCGNGFTCGTDGEQCDDGFVLASGPCPLCMNATCEDGFVEAGVELCGDIADVCPFPVSECPPVTIGGACPCAQGDCVFGVTTQVVRVAFETAGSNPVSMQFVLDYPERKVGLPGFSNNGTVLSRVDVKALNRVIFGFPTINDSDFSLIVGMTTDGTETISDGPYFETSFDACSGATLPSIDEYACIVDQAFSAANADVSGNTTCTISILP